MKNKNFAIVVAAGKGKRMGADINKIYLKLGDKPVIIHTLEAFCQAREIDGIVIVISSEDRNYFEEEVVEKYSFSKPILIVEGGKERQMSVYNGLMALPKDADIVAIHDGARPFVTADMVDRSVAGARKYGAVVMATPVKDTIKEASENLYASSTLDRNKLWAVQTPQTFAYELIIRAHEEAKKQGIVATDDSALVERLGEPVKILRGSYDNIKITTWEDMLLAEQILLNRSKSRGEFEP